MMKLHFRKREEQRTRLEGLSLSKEEMDAGIIVTYCRQCQKTRKHETVEREAGGFVRQYHLPHTGFLQRMALRRCLVCGTVHMF